MTTEPMDVMLRSAEISRDGRYRYSLHRDWWRPYERRHWVTFVMLNPSIADAENDDPTIRRCVNFARALGGTGLVVVNLYAYRATDPTELKRAEDPIGPENDARLSTFFELAAKYDFPIIAAWGTHAEPDRVAAVLQLPGADRLQALRTTKQGAPAHPLRLPGTLTPTPWAPSLEEARHG